MKLKTEFSFDAAHRLVGYQGLCSNLHGHIWKIEIEIEGKETDSIGIMWDFTNVKILKTLFDHKTILKNCEENKELILAIRNIRCGTEDNVYLMYENPTAENLCKEILEACKHINPNFKYKITVWESSKSSCEVSG